VEIKQERYAGDISLVFFNIVFWHGIGDKPEFSFTGTVNYCNNRKFKRRFFYE